MIPQELIERVVVIPERDESDTPKVGSGAKGTAERCREVGVRVSQTAG
jgi:hypothetical protein